MDIKQRAANIEYALVQGFYWMGFCVSVSFAAVFLQNKGYSNSQLGLVMAAGNVFGFLLSPFLASVVDRSRRITVCHCILALLAMQALFLVSFILLPERSLLLSVCYSLYMACIIAVNPLNTQLSFELEHGGFHINYGAARGTGSLFFALIAILLGRLTARCGAGMLPAAGLCCIAAQGAILLPTALRRGRGLSGGFSGRRQEAAGSTLPEFIRANRRFCAMMLGVALLFFAHNLVNNYLINVVRNVGGDSASMGSLNAFMALFELPAMFLYDRLTRRVSCSVTLRFAAVVFALKALAIALSVNMTMLYAAHLLQALSFAVLTPALVRYVNLTIDHRDSVKGQAISYGMTTLGSIFSSSLGGLMFDAFSVSTTLLIGSAASALGAAVCIGFTEQSE